MSRVRETAEGTGLTEDGPRRDGADAPLLALENVTRRFGTLKAVDSVSLNVYGNEKRAVIGPNGAGKTTLFDVVAGDLSLTTGRIFFEGEEVTSLAAHRRARLGIARTFQKSTLFPALTVLENLLLSVQASSPQRRSPLASRWRDEIVDRAGELLARVDIGARADVAVAELSHGEQRQIEILLAASREPKLLLLDEPTAGLARAELPLIADTLQELCSGVTMVLIEHDMSFVFGLAEIITVLHHGSVVAEGTVDEVRSDSTVQAVYLGETV